MGWEDLIQSEEESVTLPWVGGRQLRSADRVWSLSGPLPPEHGWHTFKITGRKAQWSSSSDSQPEMLKHQAEGYLVGDRVILDGASANEDPAKLPFISPRVHLLEPGLDRFVRIQVGRVYKDGPCIYESLAMPLGPESEVLQALLDDAPSVAHIKDVSPALDASYRLELWHRAEAVKRREELEKLRREEEERARRRDLLEKTGNAVTRRELAQVDFGEAAKAALAMSGAVYLDHQDSYHRNEVVVRFRHLGRRFECTCDRYTLRIIDSGVCLTAHSHSGDFKYGTKGDSFFTLETLPGVIAEADRLGVLVVFRHVD